MAKTREVYERAIANVPPANEKRFWQRYIYIWINYALYEELEARDVERTREVYRACLKVIPHAEFSFSKIWIMAAKFELRQRRLDACRKIFGLAIGLAPKAKIFATYIEIEFQLGNVDRCRTLYEKYLEIEPQNCSTWIKYAELERSLGEIERGRSIFELAVDQAMLDMPEGVHRFRDVRGRARAYARALRASSRAYEARQGMDVLRALRSNTDCCCG
jgi:crooked neck